MAFEWLADWLAGLGVPEQRRRVLRRSDDALAVGAERRVASADIISLNRTRQSVMPERTADVQAHWTRRGVLARIDAALAELGQDPQILTPEILATVEHLHSGGLATTREQAKRITLTKDSRVLDVGCGIG